MQNKTNTILTISTIILIVLCFVSIWSPMNFAQQRKQREQQVKERLISIRQAEEAYRTRHGTYCGNIDSLVKEMRMPKATVLIPGTANKKWKIQTAVVPGSNNKPIHLMECGAKYSDYLHGLDGQEIERITRKATESNKYPGLKIGNIITPNNNAGNWE